LLEIVANQARPGLVEYADGEQVIFPP